jgi:peptide-methionine (S)-S-oxide reductase
MDPTELQNTFLAVRAGETREGWLEIGTVGCGQAGEALEFPGTRSFVDGGFAMVNEQPQPVSGPAEVATLGAGCFWCVEAIFGQLDGVISVESGYSGGHLENPTYEQVCSGSTGHAEVCQICFNPERISYRELLEVFWQTHDPTTLNRQGNDVGTQYRSAVFYHDDQQRATAEACKAELDASSTWADPIVTEIVPFQHFFPAEDYHQDYFARNPDAPYCAVVIRPKVQKFRDIFKRTRPRHL